MDDSSQLDFDFADLTQEPLRATASIHKSGKLGFDSDAAELMDLEKGKLFSVAIGEGGIREQLILLPYREEYPEQSKIRTARAGSYFYLNLRNFFDVNAVPYEKRKIRYDIDEGESNGRRCFFLNAKEEKPRD